MIFLHIGTGPPSSDSGRGRAVPRGGVNREGPGIRDNQTWWGGTPLSG